MPTFELGTLSVTRPLQRSVRRAHECDDLPHSDVLAVPNFEVGTYLKLRKRQVWRHELYRDLNGSTKDEVLALCGGEPCYETAIADATNAKGCANVVCWPRRSTMPRIGCCELHTSSDLW